MIEDFIFVKITNILYLYKDLIYGNFELKEVFSPVSFVSNDGEFLSVVMRDSGFEVWYKEKEEDTKYQIFEFKNGVIKEIKK